MKTFERRMAVTELEVREADGDFTLTGYASTFNQPYDMGWYTETVDPDAFTRTLKTNPDVQLLINHDGLALADTATGTLSLNADGVGLLASAKLDRNDPDVARLAPKMRRGTANKMSFGFRVVPTPKGDPGDVWSPDMTIRTLRNLDLNGGDVSIVGRPANPGTSASLRGVGQAIDALASALRALETREASDDDIRGLLARMQVAYGEPTVDIVAKQVVVEIEETSDDGETVREALAILNVRKRRVLAL